MENKYVLGGPMRPSVYSGDDNSDGEEKSVQPNKKPRTEGALSPLSPQIRRPQSQWSSNLSQIPPTPGSPFQHVSNRTEPASEPSRAEGGEQTTPSAETQQSHQFSIELAGYLLLRAAGDRAVAPSDVAALIRAQKVVDVTLAAHTYGRANVKGDDRSGPLRYTLAQYHLRTYLDDLYASGASVFSRWPTVDEYDLSIAFDAAASRFMGAGQCESFTDVAVASLKGWMAPNEFAHRAFHKEGDHAWLQIERRKPHSRATTPEPMIVDPWAGPRAILESDGHFSADRHAVHLERRMDPETVARIAEIAEAAFNALGMWTTPDDTLEVTWGGGDPEDPEAPTALADLIEEPQWDSPSVLNRAWVSEVLDSPKNSDQKRMVELAVEVAISMGVPQEMAPRYAQGIIDAAERMR